MTVKPPSLRHWRPLLPDPAGILPVAPGLLPESCSIPDHEPAQVAAGPATTFPAASRLSGFPARARWR